MEINAGDNYPDPTTGMGNELMSVWSAGLQIDGRVIGPYGDAWRMGYCLDIIFLYSALLFLAFFLVIAGRQAPVGNNAYCHLWNRLFRLSLQVCLVRLHTYAL